MYCEMKNITCNNRGFTLIEIATSLIIIMIISVVAGMGLIAISRGYIFSKKNSVTAQQGQIAMTRLKKEISNIQLVTSSSANSITYKRCQDISPPCGTLKDVTVSWAGSNSPLLIDSDKLVEPVVSFSLAYFDSYNSSASSYSSSTSIIEITLQLKSAEDVTIEFKDRVNLYLETGG
jgi:type II secretory pathway pseudopilin PulG